MKLGVARLCLDCDEVHDQERCPTCASEVFAFLTRWVPGPRSNGRLAQSTRPPDRPELETYRQITGAQPATSGRGRLLVRGALGLGVLGVAGWMWRRANGKPAASDIVAKSDASAEEKPT